MTTCLKQSVLVGKVVLPSSIKTKVSLSSENERRRQNNVKKIIFLPINKLPQSMLDEIDHNFFELHQS